MYFRGRSSHTLDEKGRIAIPARFKEVMDKRREDCLVITNHEKCLWGFMRAEWKAIEDSIAELSIFDRNAEEVIHFLISGAVECPLKSGRITIPLNLRKFAGFGKEVVLIGRLNFFEIWDAERWEEKFAISKVEFSSAQKALADLGVGFKLTSQTSQ